MNTKKPRRLREIVEDEVFTAPEAAEYLGISAQDLSKEIKGGLIPCIRDRLFLKEDLDEYDLRVRGGSPFRNPSPGESSPAKKAVVHKIYRLENDDTGQVTTLEAQNDNGAKLKASRLGKRGESSFTLTTPDGRRYRRSIWKKKDHIGWYPWERVW